MFNVGGAELFVILLLALVVLGPDKLPSAMRTVGQWAGEMRKMANGFQTEMNKAMNDPLDVKGTENAAAEKKAAAAKRGDVDPSKGTTTTAQGSEAGDAKAGASSADDAPSNGSSSNGSTSNGATADEAAGDAPAASD